MYVGHLFPGANPVQITVKGEKRFCRCVVFGPGWRAAERENLLMISQNTYVKRVLKLTGFEPVEGIDKLIGCGVRGP